MKLVSMEADGAPFTPPPPSLCQCSVLRIFKAIATRIRRKSKQTLKSPRILLLWISYHRKISKETRETSKKNSAIFQSYIEAVKSFSPWLYCQSFGCPRKIFLYASAFKSKLWINQSINQSINEIKYLYCT